MLQNATGTDPFAVLGNEVDWISLVAQADKSNDVVVVDATEQINFPSTFRNVGITARQQRIK